MACSPSSQLGDHRVYDGPFLAAPGGGQATRVERQGADFRGLKDALLQKVQPPMPFAVPVWAGETVIQGDLVDSLAMLGKQPLAEGVDILAQHLLFRR